MNLKIFIALTVLSLFVFVSAVSACSCIAVQPSVEQQLADADGVVVAEVTRVNGPGMGSDKAIELSVTQSFKGIPTGRAVIYTYRDSAGCGYEFTEGETYLIYTGLDENGKMYTGLCSGTVLASVASE